MPSDGDPLNKTVNMKLSDWKNRTSSLRLTVGTVGRNAYDCSSCQWVIEELLIWKLTDTHESALLFRWTWKVETYLISRSHTAAVAAMMPDQSQTPLFHSKMRPEQANKTIKRSENRISAVRRNLVYHYSQISYCAFGAALGGNKFSSTWKWELCLKVTAPRETLRGKPKISEELGLFDFFFTTLTFSKTFETSHGLPHISTFFWFTFSVSC